MMDVKAAVAQGDVLALLGECFPAPISRLTAVTEGRIARTFAFAVGGREYIIRFNTDHMAASFEKEAYLYRRIASPRIPIPAIVRVGRLGQFPYVISARVPGKTMDKLSGAEYRRMLPALVDTLDAIHQVDVRDARGHGTFDDSGVGMFPSWRSYLESIREEEEPWDFYGEWHALFEDTFLERDLFEGVYDRMVRGLDACPEERCLVHGNYGFGNLVVQEGRVTGVLDWIDAKYGDFLYDVAWLDYWFPGGGLAERFEHHYAARGIAVPGYGQRLDCYRSFIALDALRFYAKVGDREGYEWARDRILSTTSATA
jgi:hygromycin-B 4-O-kinase